jgi:hypothetical protein
MIAAIGLALSKFGAWVANNPAVQWALGALGVIIALILWGERREGQGRSQEKVKQRERDVRLQEEATETHQEIIEQETEDADAAQEAGVLAGRAEPTDLERMSDAEWELSFGYPRKAGDPGYRS